MIDTDILVLKQWSQSLDERCAIEDFLDWAQGDGKLSYASSMTLSDMLDMFYGINRKDLERARQALLTENDL